MSLNFSTESGDLFLSGWNFLARSLYAFFISLSLIFLLGNNILNFIKTKIPLDILVDLRKTSGESLILLTEAPHSSLIKWASPMYETSGSFKKMIATGFHKTEVWLSVLFQLTHIFDVLQRKEIYFEELSLENNIYIKDLFYDQNTLNYWLYKINGLDYYVPNYGYLVLFDSKYGDSKTKNFKIKSKMLFPNKNDKINDVDDDTLNFDYKKEIYNQFKSIFDPSIFNLQLKKLGCLEPDNFILNLLRNINNDPDEDICNYILRYFGKYLNNRIGKNLNRNEKESINILNRPNFRKGELLIRQERYDEYKWVLFRSNDDINPNMKNIISFNNSGNISFERCNTFSLIAPSPSETFKPYGIEENKIIELDILLLYCCMFKRAFWDSLLVCI